ncbi:hypothetical protein OK016_09040 [Vibrio chagasii]|nr:hypothetical protein [Vibrio chagasii]
MKVFVCYDTPKGPVIFRHPEHAKAPKKTQQKSTASPIPYTEREIMEATRETLRQNKLKSAYIRPLGFVGNVGLGVCHSKT